MDLDFGTAFVCAPSCGDVLKLYISIDEDYLVEDIKSKSFGCDAVKDIGRRLDIMIGMSVDEIVMLDPAEFVDDTDSNIHVGVLIINGIRAAVTNYARKKYNGEDDCGERPSMANKT